jgi:hypothetical protein
MVETYKKTSLKTSTNTEQSEAAVHKMEKVLLMWACLNIYEILQVTPTKGKSQKDHGMRTVVAEGEILIYLPIKY